MKTILSALSIAYWYLIGTETDASRFPSPRILGGRPAKQGEAPYQLTLKVGDVHECGASLVEVDGLQIGVTGAHCIFEHLLDQYDVIAGDINFADNTGIEKRLHVSHVVVHPDWDIDAETPSNDIALLFLNDSYILDENINTVPLPTQDQVTSDQENLKVSGWGFLKYNSPPIPNKLQIAEIPVVNDTTCQKAYENYRRKVSEHMICTLAPEENLSPCRFDSGSPGISEAGYLAGIVSWGYAFECGHPDYPSVYTKVSHFVDFIENTVADHKKSI